MRLLYFIRIDDRWKQVSHEEYNAFDGEKETRPSTWGLQIINAMLLPLRYRR
jgi:hypothetical protein